MEEEFGPPVDFDKVLQKFDEIWIKYFYIPRNSLGSEITSTYDDGKMPFLLPIRPSNQFLSTLRVRFTSSPWDFESKIFEMNSYLITVWYQPLISDSSIDVWAWKLNFALACPSWDAPKVDEADLGRGFKVKKMLKLSKNFKSLFLKESFVRLSLVISWWQRG